MDLTSLRSLINSISRFIHLVTCCTSMAMPAGSEYKSVMYFLKHLKPLLDGLTDFRYSLDEALFKECEELDFAVSEARAFLEKWSPRKCKILCVIETMSLVEAIQVSSVKLCQVLCAVSELSPTILSLSRAQLCMRECQNLVPGKLSKCIAECLENQNEGKAANAEHILMIIEFLHLGSNQAFLGECIALEKERQRIEVCRPETESDRISHAVELVNLIREHLIRLKSAKIFNGTLIPSYFCCPLTLDLMQDPVILSSGQTYERVAIKNWLDDGLTTCPLTHQKLDHKNLIPNYTVKALMENWCKENKVELSSNSPHIVCVDHSKSSIYKDELECSLQKINLASRSSSGIGTGFEKQKIYVSTGFGEEEDEADRLKYLSPEHSYVHSRSESESSAVSSIDYVPSTSTEISRILRKENDRFEDIPSVRSASSCLNRSSGQALLREKHHHSSKANSELAVNGSYNHQLRAMPLSSEAGSDDSTTASHVEKLIEDLKSESTQTAAAGELRLLAKFNVENRVIIDQCGAISPLISLLNSNVELTQEHAVTALLNLSISEKLKAKIAEESALEPFIHVLRTGNAEAKENAAATLFSLSLLDEYRIKIGRSSAVEALVDLLGSGTIRGKKDAATALFNLSIFHENKERIVQAGAVKYLVELINPATEMVDKAVALLANLSTTLEGCSAIAREGGIPLLVETIDTGSQRGKENAASVLMQLCLNSSRYCRTVLQEGAVPPLVALTQSGTPRAKEKAQQLLSHFRSQRESATARGRSC